MWAQLRALTPTQRNAFLASYLGWTLDAFDFFILVFVIPDVAKEFHATKTAVTRAIFLTLAFRPVGAFLFGWAGDKFGRRVPLMIDVIFYSVMELLSGFAPTLTAFLVLRAIFGIAMGGEWGLGASLAMETVPAETRGLLSGILQQGYPVGYLLAALVFRFVFHTHALGWRWMFFIGVLPALLSLFIRSRVQESPAWERNKAAQANLNLGSAVRSHLGLFAYMAVLMAAFNFMSHGTQDMYPTFLRVQRHFAPDTVSNIAIIYNLGAICGGVLFGGLSQRIGRRRAIIIAALLALPVVPLWAYSHTAAMLALGAFAMQFFVQGAWGVIPAHLSELSPTALRGTFTGFAYQTGNLIASYNATLQSGIAEAHGNDYSLALAATIVVVLLAVAGITALGREAPQARFETEGAR
ncbi:MAG: MFS transporter [Armatimonadetes bacterium]|nr:MFS transporter [Armatimonadota bacterium]